jgi:hypothetical protein
MKAPADILGVPSLAALFTESKGARRDELEQEAARPQVQTAEESKVPSITLGNVYDDDEGQNESISSNVSLDQRVERKVRAHVRLVVEPSTEAAVSNAIKDTPAGRFEAAVTQDYLTIAYDVVLSGECITCPHLRTPPLREPHLNRLVRGAVKARSEERSLPKDVQVVMFDSGHTGHDRSFKAAMKDADQPHAKPSCTKPKLVNRLWHF